MNNWIDLKHISKPGNRFDRHDVYYGTIDPFMSYRNYAFGYIENGKIGYVTFIRRLK